MQKLPPATLFKRLLALVYDAFLVLALWFITAGLFVLVYPLTGLPTDSLNGVETATPAALRWGLLPLLLFVTWAFNAWFWTHGGQTLGMRAWRLKVMTYKGGPLTVRQTLVRFVVAWFSFLFLFAGYLLALLPPYQTLHDRASLSATVQLPKPDKKKRNAAAS